jgi:ABC-type sugar transport system permease subunit
MYETAFDRFRFGMGAAIMVLVFLGVALLIWLLYAAVGGWGYDEEV